MKLTRAESALRQQVASCDDAGPADRAFLVAARYGAREAMLTAIARQRRCPPNELNGALASAVDTLLENFGALRQRLTTPPTGDSARANKQANLAFQLRAQAATLRKHFAVDAQRARLDRALANEALAELAAPYFGPAYVGGVLARLNAADMRFPEWSGKLFRRRIARWPLLGWIAWPAMALAGALGGAAGPVAAHGDRPTHRSVSRRGHRSGRARGRTARRTPRPSHPDQPRTRSQIARAGRGSRSAFAVMRPPWPRRRRTPFSPTGWPAPVAYSDASFAAG
jgi:hypothetical protein